MEDEVKERKRNPLTLPSSPFFFWKLAFVKLLGAAPVSPTAARAPFIGKGLKSNWPYSWIARPLPALMVHNTRQCRDWGMQVIQSRGRKLHKSTEGKLDQISRKQLKCKHFDGPWASLSLYRVSSSEGQHLVTVYSWIREDFTLTSLSIWGLKLALIFLLSMTYLVH